MPLVSLHYISNLSGLIVLLGLLLSLAHCLYLHARPACVCDMSMASAFGQLGASCESPGDSVCNRWISDRLDNALALVIARSPNLDDDLAIKCPKFRGASVASSYPQFAALSHPKGGVIAF